MLVATLFASGRRLEVYRAPSFRVLGVYRAKMLAGSRSSRLTMCPSHPSCLRCTVLISGWRPTRAVVVKNTVGYIVVKDTVESPDAE